MSTRQESTRNVETRKASNSKGNRQLKLPKGRASQYWSTKLPRNVPRAFHGLRCNNSCVPNATAARNPGMAIKGPNRATRSMAELFCCGCGALPGAPDFPLLPASTLMIVLSIQALVPEASHQFFFQI